MLVNLVTALSLAVGLISAASIELPRQVDNATCPNTFPPYVAANDCTYSSCENANWPPPGPGALSGSILQPQLPNAELQAALAEVSADNIKNIISKLVSFGTRHTLSPQNDTQRGIGAARAWIKSEFEKYAAESDGRMTVDTPGYIQEPQSRIPEPVYIANVQATLQGTVQPDRYYVTLGHYDTRVSDVLNWWDDQPGANDDASGVAVAMEIARIMAKRKHAATIVFAATAAEEQGLLGAQFMAQTFKNNSINVDGMLNVDLVGSSTGSRGEKEPYTVRLFSQGPPLTESAADKATRLSIGGENDSPSRNLGRFVTEVAANKYTGMNINLIYRLDRYGRGGDHRPFLEAGFSAVRFVEANENFDHQHQDIRLENGTQYGDLEEFLDYEYIARVAKVDLAAMWSLANAPSSLKNVKVTPQGNDARLTWDVSKFPDIKGYEVVWRPTNSPQWTHSQFVGDVSTATVELSIDNVIFGVRVVGANGYKSPATLPFPA